MPYRAWFQCISGCDEKYELNEVIYQCKKCGDLLEVKHDMDKLHRHFHLNIGRSSLTSAIGVPSGLWKCCLGQEGVGLSRS